VVFAQRVVLAAALLPDALSLSVGNPRLHIGSGVRSIRMGIAVDEKSEPLKFVTLKNKAGDSAKVYTFGACVTSYVKDGNDALMVRPDAKMDGSKPISGGIPHCFPQFGPGEIQQHGFARNLDWEIAESEDGESPSILLRLKENEYTLAMWPHKFSCDYRITLAADRLSTELTVTNTGDSNFDFQAALHSYWSVSSIDAVKIGGSFSGSSFLDKTQDPPALTACKADTIQIEKETDSVYEGVSGEVSLSDAGKKSKLTLSNFGWSDTVIWNPYGDEGMGYNSFVCVESAQASKPVLLEPSAYWTAQMDVIQ